jgi:predicted dinucleotide-binding enzyme
VDDLRLGIVGAGKLGTALARAAVQAGYDVAISGSGPSQDIALTVDVLAPGARAVTTGDVVRHADVIVLAVPTHRFRELPRHLFDGKVLVDAMNYWEPVDGTDDELEATAEGTSTIVRERFAAARVVKSLNQLGYHELEENRRPPAAPDRVAIGAAGDDRLAVRVVMQLVDRLGFDPVDAGPLENGLALEPDGSPYAVTYSARELSDLIARRKPVRAGSAGSGLDGSSAAGRLEPLEPALSLGLPTSRRGATGA